MADGTAIRFLICSRSGHGRPNARCGLIFLEPIPRVRELRARIAICEFTSARGFRSHADTRVARGRRPAWEHVRDVAFEASSLLGPASPGRLRLCEFAAAGAGVPLRRAELPAGRRHPRAADLMYRICCAFRYDPKATVISMPLKEVFEKRHGVCHTLPTLYSRACAGPARRYVSGISAPIRRPASGACRARTRSLRWVSGLVRRGALAGLGSI